MIGIEAPSYWTIHPGTIQAMDERQGILFLVVGPSGVGKDSLIDGARHWLNNDQSYHFPQRVITRSEGAGGEDHQASTLADFERLERDGGLMLSWEAHGHRYGIPKSAELALANGRSVIVNVSRQIIGSARQRWSPVRVILVSAPHALLAERLAARGRESEKAIEHRLERAGSYAIMGDDVRELVNADRLDRAIDRFVALLEHEMRMTLTKAERETRPSG